MGSIRCSAVRLRARSAPGAGRRGERGGGTRSAAFVGAAGGERGGGEVEKKKKEEEEGEKRRFTRLPGIPGIIGLGFSLYLCALYLFFTFH